MTDTILHRLDTVASKLHPIAWCVIATAIAALVFVASYLLSAGDDTSPDSIQSAAVTTTVQSVVTTAPPRLPGTVAATAEPFPDGITRGIHTVGETILPGLYRVTGRATIYTQDGEVIHVAESGHGYGLVIISEPAATVGVIGKLTPIGSPIDPVGEGWSDGGYLVGFDLDPGPWRVDSAAGVDARIAVLDRGLSMVTEAVGAGASLVVPPDAYAVVYRGGPLVQAQ